MLRPFRLSQAKARLGDLLDRAGSGDSIYLRHKKRLYRIQPAPEAEPVPRRPFGFFSVDEGDPMVALANSAPADLAPR